MLVRGASAVSGSDAVGRVASDLRADAPSAPEEPSSVSFSDVLGGMVDAVAQKGRVAEAQSAALARGSIDDIHGTMISVKEAEISLKLVGSIRNKLMDAFQELWRTNV
jgi:flagellar hook-basal body complex protein FliE